MTDSVSGGLGRLAGYEQAVYPKLSRHEFAPAAEIPSAGKEPHPEQKNPGAQDLTTIKQPEAIIAS